MDFWTEDGEEICKKMEEYARSLAKVKKAAKADLMRTKSSRVLFNVGDALGEITDTSITLEELLETDDTETVRLGEYQVVAKKVQAQKSLNSVRWHGRPAPRCARLRAHGCAPRVGQELRLRAEPWRQS